MRNARFWIIWHESPVKITLKPGQTLSAATGGPDEEGWDREELADWDDDRLADTVLWLACCDFADWDGTESSPSGSDIFTLDN